MARTIRFHLDEHCDPAIAAGLRLHGVDVTTTHEASLPSCSRHALKSDILRKTATRTSQEVGSWGCIGLAQVARMPASQVPGRPAMDVLSHVSTHPARQIEELLPDCWHATRGAAWRPGTTRVAEQPA